MKNLVIIASLLFSIFSYAQSSRNEPTPSDFEKFIMKSGSLILTSSEEVFESGGLESLEITLVVARNMTRGDETAKAIKISVNKSNAYLSKSELSRLISQMEKIQLLIVDGELTKKHNATFNIRNSVHIEAAYSESKKEWRYEVGVLSDGRKRMKELTATDFQDIRIKLEQQISKL